MEFKSTLPHHIYKLELELNRALEKIDQAPYKSKKFYAAIKYAQDIQRQINLNKTIANAYGVEYELQNRAMGASS